MPRQLPRLVLLLALAFFAARAAAADADVIAAVRAADDERVAATLAADRARLEAIFSEQLHYAHSNGKVDTKASYVAALAGRQTVYSACDYVQRDFLPVAPGVVLMTGRARIQAGNAAGTNLLDLNFLAVWREEGGRWRFLAWKSSRLPPPAPPQG